MKLPSEIKIYNDITNTATVLQWLTTTEDIQVWLSKLINNAV